MRTSEVIRRTTPLYYRATDPPAVIPGIEVIVPVLGADLSLRLARHQLPGPAFPFPVPAQKFPVYLRREFRCKSLNRRFDFRLSTKVQRQNVGNSLYFPGYQGKFP